jgi:hypothetical protein
VKRSISAHVNELISDRLKAAMKDDESTEESTGNPDVAREKEAVTNKVNTTGEELEAFYIVKSILRGTIASDRITYRDSQTYFAVFIDDNNRKAVCRLYFNTEANKRITFLDENKKEVHHKISSLDDIYEHSGQLIDAVKKYL